VGRQDEKILAAGFARHDPERSVRRHFSEAQHAEHQNVDIKTVDFNVLKSKCIHD
jgi:hypothetical protein